MAVAPTDEVNAVSVSDDSSKEENVVSSTSSNVQLDNVSDDVTDKKSIVQKVLRPRWHRPV